MLEINRFALVSYSTNQMFNLVNDVASYSKFIPGCNLSKVLEYNKDGLIAKINIIRYGMNISFVTRNIITKDQSIVIKLIDGPVKYLFGYWNFVASDKGYSIVTCCFKLEFFQSLFDILFPYYIEELSNNIFLVFMNRAKSIYNE